MDDTDHHDPYGFGDDAELGAPLAPPIHRAAYPCVHCGYELAGMTVGGACPECGQTIGVVATTQTSALAAWALGLGITSLAGLFMCGFLALAGPLAMFLAKRAARDAKLGLAPPSSLGMAKGGWWCGLIATVLFVGMIAIYVVLIVFRRFW